MIVVCVLINMLACAEKAPAEQKKAAAANTPKAPADGILRGDTRRVIIVEVVGRGSDRGQAVKNALCDAVSRVRGVKVDSGSYEFAFRGAGAGIETQQPGGSRLQFDSVGVTTRGTAYTTEIEGLVKGYDVLEEKQLQDGSYQVKLKVSVFDYGARGRTGRIKIALMPAKTMNRSYSFLGLTVSGETLSKLFSHLLAVGLTQTNKFAVLDRESVTDFDREKRVVFSQDAPLRERARIAETLGAHYLLIGTITRARIEKIERYLRAARYTSQEFKARFVFDYRLVDSSTKQVVFASIAQKYLEDEQVRDLADEWDPAEWDPAQVRDAFLTVVANEVVEEIIDRVYPTRIVAIQPDGTVVLNLGGSRISEGMLLDVFAEGRQVRDPDTGESLGRIENRVGTVEIQRVGHTIAFAKVIDGGVSGISERLVCRPRPVKRQYNRGARPDIKRTKSGGVKLPFDK